MLTAFAREVVTASPSDGVVDVARRMRDRGVGCVVVVEGKRPVGIVTDRDLALRVVAAGLPHDVPVSAIMTADPTTLSASSDVGVAVRTMRKSGARRLPLVDADGALAGIVTHDDLVVRLAHELDVLGQGVEDAVDAPDLR